jgi:GNAT superfamily N-acetyltransferase
MTIQDMEDRFRRFVDEEGWSVDLFLLDSEVVGYATHRREPEPSAVNAERVFLRQFYIARHYRRHGLGQAAFDALTAARFKPGDRVILEAIENNPGGRVFWLRVGFTPYSAILEHFVK